MSSTLPISSRPLPIDLSTETLIGLPAAANRLPAYRGGRPVSPSTLWRWIFTGVQLPDGSRVRLEAIRLGRRWLTSLEAIARFSAAQTPVRAPQISLPSSPASYRTPAKRTRDSQRADEELRRRE